MATSTLLFRKAIHAALAPALAFVLILGAGSLSSANAASILLGSGTLNNANDLTLIQTGGGSVLEFLDLSSTDGQSVAGALGIYAPNGFRWANGTEISALFDAFGIIYAAVANTATDLNASLVSRTTFVSYLGVTYGTDGAIGWLDDLTTATNHTYACISISDCNPDSFTNNTAGFWPQDSGAGVFLVRNGSAAVPEPATLLLLGTGLGAAAMKRRKIGRK